MVGSIGVLNFCVQGRNGKGSIFVMASGNGGANNDSCAANGYASSIYTISVGSADQTSQQAFYDEQCASKMVVTFSFNSSSGHNQVVCFKTVVPYLPLIPLNMIDPLSKLYSKPVKRDGHKSNYVK